MGRDVVAMTEAQVGRGIKDSNPSAAFCRLSYAFLAAVDIEGFSRLDALEQVTIQDHLRGVLETAAFRAGLDRTLWDIQVNGDGELAVLPSDIDGARLVADYPRELEAALTELNVARDRGPRLRIRAALHHGTVAMGKLGAVGKAPIVVSRLLDSDRLRQELRHRRTDLVLVVSDALFTDVIESRFRGLDPDEFSRIEEYAKGQSYIGYIHRPGTGSGHRAGNRTNTQLNRAWPGSASALLTLLKA